MLSQLVLALEWVASNAMEKPLRRLIQEVLERGSCRGLENNLLVDYPLVS